MKTTSRIIIAFLFIFEVTPGLAQIERRKNPWWNLELPKEPERPRSDFWAPFVSLILPSFDQFYERQTTAAGVYLTYTLVGFSQMVGGLDASNTGTALSSKNDPLRKTFFGAQMVQTAGSLSAFHSFRSAVESRRKLGEYSFLPKEDSADLLKAPLEFSYLKRTTTWAVLGLELVALAIDLNSYRGTTHFTGSDAAFTAGYSYQAGVGEEAIFRGWMMPYLHNGGITAPISNLITATSFALAHVSKENPTPLPQFLLGWYLGQVTQWNDWSIRESIFIHAWWDVIALGATWATLETDKNKSIFVPLLDLPISL